MIQFGWMSTSLAVGAAHGLVTAALLATTPRNAQANRFLALLIVLMTAQLVPYIIGFAGFYDDYPALSYLPVNVSLGYGPALYFYVCGLTAQKPAQKWSWHFLPMLVQLGYYVFVFLHPLAFKNRWDTYVHVPYVDPAETMLIFASFGGYLWAALRRSQSYQAWLDANLSNREEFRLSWLRSFLLLLSLTLLLWIGFQLTDWFLRDIGYFQWFWFYVWLTGLVYVLGLLGWRNAGLAYPQPGPAVSAPEPEPEHTPEQSAAPAPPARDWQKQGQLWAAEIAARGWWRDPALTLATLARHLGTNASYVSRALNEGLGETFNGFINRLRVEAVQKALAAGGTEDLLTLAFDAGFNSKASFNRAFKAVTGKTPSENRQKQAGARLIS
jgi:AraC-like DNA-binding protein